MGDFPLISLALGQVIKICGRSLQYLKRSLKSENLLLSPDLSLLSAQKLSLTHNPHPHQFCIHLCSEIIALWPHSFIFASACDLHFPFPGLEVQVQQGAPSWQKRETLETL